MLLESDLELIGHWGIPARTVPYDLDAVLTALGHAASPRAAGVATSRCRRRQDAIPVLLYDADRRAFGAHALEIGVQQITGARLDEIRIDVVCTQAAAIRGEALSPSEQDLLRLTRKSRPIAGRQHETGNL